MLSTAIPWLEASEDATLVGLSGSSGGAVSALAGWDGYLEGGPEGAVETAEAFLADHTSGQHEHDAQSGNTHHSP